MYIASFVLASVGLAQQIVVPAQYATADAPSVRWVAGFTSAQRQQLLVGDRHLVSMRGRSLIGITLRRDAGIGHALQGGECDLTLRVSSARSSPDDPSATMDQNVGADVITVFAGRITLPGSPAVVGSTVPWDAANTVAISFTQGFPYVAGDLCIDLLGAPVVGSTSPQWAVDALRGTARGTVDNVGSSCAAVAAVVNAIGERATSFVAEHQLVAGGTVGFVARGTSDASAILTIGFRTFPQPVDLAFLGARGCRLHVDGAVSVSSVFGPAVSPFATGLGGHARVAVEIPNVNGVRGAALFAQWIELGSPLWTSNALRCTISTSVPGTGLALVSAPWEGAQPPTIGDIDVDAGFVVRFDYR
jgi:hypothetical protein